MLVIRVTTLADKAVPSNAQNVSARSASGASADNALIRQIAHGSRSAMEALYRRHYLRLYRFALRFVDDPAAAEDLVADVFIEVWKKPDFAQRSKASTWLLGITRHKVLSLYSRRQPEAWDDVTCNAVPDRSDDAETTVNGKQARSALVQCLAKLSPVHREIIDLVYYHSKSIAEVAEITGTPCSTVKTRMHYARKRLANLLALDGFERSSALG